MTTDREKPKYSEKKLSQWHFTHHKSHMNFKIGLPQSEAGGRGTSRL
jgi:hypothetical protein